MEVNHLEDEIVNWIQEQVEARGAEGAVIGLSGGIDSSLVAALTKKALGDDSLGVLLPSSGSVTKDVEYANLVADEFDLETKTVNLKETYESIEGTFSNIDLDEKEREYWPQTKIPTVEAAEQNIGTRLRMMTLYYIAEKMNYVVMGTSNKSEIMVGYYTLYGDGATDMRPIGDLTKTEVWELAEHIGIPQEIIDRKPTGSLRGEETSGDEEEFGIDYHRLDKIYQAILNDESLSEFNFNEVKRVKELIDAAKDKDEIPTFKKETVENKKEKAIS